MHGGGGTQFISPKEKKNLWQTATEQLSAFSVHIPHPGAVALWNSREHPRITR